MKSTIIPVGEHRIVTNTLATGEIAVMFESEVRILTPLQASQLACDLAARVKIGVRA